MLRNRPALVAALQPLWYPSPIGGQPGPPRVDRCIRNRDVTVAKMDTGPGTARDCNQPLQMSSPAPDRGLSGPLDGVRGQLLRLRGRPALRVSAPVARPVVGRVGCRGLPR